MTRRRKGTVEALVILGIAAIVAFGLVIFQPFGDGHPKSDSSFGTAATSTSMNSQPATTTGQATATVTAAATVTVPPDALIQTADQAVARGMQMARDLDAQAPHVASVRLVTLHDATAAVRRPGDASGDDNPSAQGDPVWIVQFDNDRFRFPKCPASTNSAGTPEPCASASTAIFIIDPADGTLVEMTLGLAVPR